MLSACSREVSVLVADDHAILRKSLRDLLEYDGLQVVGEAANGQQAVSECERLHPDVVVLDISMPLMNGFEAAQEIATRSPDTKIIFLTGHLLQEYVSAAFRVGAVAFVHKQHVTPGVIEAIEAVLEGKSYISGDAGSVQSTVAI